MTDSRWYYGVLAVAGLELVGFGLIGIQNLDGVSLVPGLLGALLVVVSFLLLPVFGACLYFDARAVRESRESWNPNPALWAGGGVALQIAAIAGGTTLYTLVAVVYMARRLHSSPAAVADEDAWAEQEAEWDD